MNTKAIMIASSLFLYLAGIFAIFAPPEFFAMFGFGDVISEPMIVLRMAGAVYVSLAVVNWIAKNSAIGGIYGRPISMGNLTHFTVGTLTIARFLLDNGLHLPMLIVMIVYIVFAVIFAWLVFFSTGLVRQAL